MAARGLGPQKRVLRGLEPEIAALRRSHRLQAVLRGLPAPGVRDAEKRRLVVMAAGDASSDELEAARLALITPPVADRSPHELPSKATDDVRTDPYYWLRDDSRKNKDVLSYLEAENTYTNFVLADTEELQASLFAEMKGRIKEEDQAVPRRKDGFMYYTRTREVAQYRVHCRLALPADVATQRPSESDELDVNDETTHAGLEEIVFDEDMESKGIEFFHVGSVDVSPDHSRVAWAVDVKGNEKVRAMLREG